MKAQRLTLGAFLLAGLVLLSAGVSVQPGGGYDLSWNTVDGGGYTWSEGEGYSLGGTIGQPDAGALSGGAYMLGGGFWAGGVARYGIYLPLVLWNW